MMRLLGRVLRWLLSGVAWVVRLALLLFLLQYSSYPAGLQWNAVADIVSPYQFDYITWELAALGVKVDQTLYGLHPFLNETVRSQLVRVYMTDLRQAQQLDADIANLFADPAVTDPQTESATLRAERDALRTDLRQRQPLIESILEGQVAAVLVEQGFGLAGQVLPPVSAHFTRVPNLLIVSPRETIRFDISINVNPMSPDEMAALEAQIDQSQAVSSLIVPLGGIALYPAMVVETSSIPFALDTIAHEWLHHYLFFFPLGLAYFSGEGFAGETRIINETTAAFFGQEMSRLVLAKYYPEELSELDDFQQVAGLMLPSPCGRGAGGEGKNSVTRPLVTAHLPLSALPLAQVDTPFDFAQEMDTTRRRVDELLAAGQVDEAEAYMEERRQVFVANGYILRKLNQAFFAFYGGYQAGGSAGAGGADPIGPAVRALREASPSLLDWVLTLRGITTRDQLLAEAARVGFVPPS